MARRVPESCTQFLERVREAFQRALTKHPDSANAVSGISTVGNHALALEHLLARSLRWTFRYVDGKSGQLEFNVECTPKRSLGIDESALRVAARQAGLRGQARIDSGRLVFSLECGHESQAHQLVDGSIVTSNLSEFAVDGMLTMLGLLHRYGEPTLLDDGSLDLPAGENDDRPITDQLRIAAERYLEDLIVEQWNRIDWGADLEYVDRQVTCGDIGIIDILARDRSSSGHVVIELKRDRSDDETFGQLSRYLGWVAENMSRPAGVPVLGIIVAATATERLRSAASTNPNVRVLCYNVGISLVPDKQPCSGK